MHSHGGVKTAAYIGIAVAMWSGDSAPLIITVACAITVVIDDPI